MFGIRESFSDERGATVAVRLRFSMGEMLGTGPRLCQLASSRPLPAGSAAGRVWKAAGSDWSSSAAPWGPDASLSAVAVRLAQCLLLMLLMLRGWRRFAGGCGGTSWR